MKKTIKGFAVIEVLLFLVFTGALAFGGYYIIKHQPPKVEPTAVGDPNETTTYTTSVADASVTFYHPSYFNQTQRQEILVNVVEPFAYYQKEILNIAPVGAVAVDVVNLKNGSNDDTGPNYSLAYSRPGANAGLVVGGNDRQDYWVPTLCTNTCIIYPAPFKDKFPKNYQAYLDSLH